MHSPQDALLAVLRGGFTASVVSKYEQQLLSFPRIAALVGLGKPLGEAVRELVELLNLGPRPDGTGDLTANEFAAFRVMAGLMPGWREPCSRTKRKVGEARWLSGDEDGVSIRRVEWIEKNRFAPAVAQAMGAVPRPAHERFGADRDRRVFAQYINPEVLATDGQRIHQLEPARLLAQMEWATRAALLATNAGVVFAASYVWEVPGFAGFLRSAGAELADLGAISQAAPSSDIAEYQESKQFEYRDDPDNVYRLSVDLNDARRVPWVTKPGHTAATDIRTAWNRAVQPGELLDSVVQVIIRRTGMTPEAVVRNLQGVPERLEGRAFVPRFVFPAIADDLPTAPASDVRRLLSAYYLESYRRDLDARLLINFPFGRYAPLETDRLKVTPVVSALHLSTALDWLGIEDFLFHQASWTEVVSFSRSAEFAVIYQRVIVDLDASALGHVLRARRSFRTPEAESMSEVSRRASALALTLAA